MTVEENFQRILDRMLDLRTRIKELDNEDSEILATMFCDGFEILFDLIVQTSGPHIQHRLKSVLDPE